MNRQGYSQASRYLARFLQVATILTFAVLSMGCPLGALGRGGGIAIPRGGGGMIARGSGGMVARGAQRGTYNTSATSGTLSEAVIAARPPGGASVLIRSSIGSSIRGAARVNRSGLIEAFHPKWSEFRTIGRINPNGELWKVNASGAPIRLAARIQRDGTIWEVDTSGNLARSIGTIRATVTGELANIRSGPSKNLGIIGELRKGDTAEILGYENGWFHIKRYDGSVGWISASLASAEVESNTSYNNSELVRSFAPMGRVENVWVNHNVLDNNIKGMKIHVRFNVQNSLREECRVAVFFYLASGEVLKDFNGQYKSDSGEVAAYASFTPGYVNATYHDLTIFMPYDELHMSNGNYNLKFKVNLYRHDAGFFAESAYQYFTFQK